MRCRSFLALAMGLVLGGVVGGVAGCGQGASSLTTVQESAVPSTPVPATSSLRPSSDLSQLFGPSAQESGSAASDEPGASPTTSQGVTIAELQAAVTMLAGQNIAFTLSDGIESSDGSYDVVSDATALTRVEDGWRYEVSAFGSDMYLFGMIPDQAVLHVVVDTLPAGHDLTPLAFPLVATRLVSGVIEATSHVNSYSGRLDLTRVAPGDTSAEGRFIAYLAAQAGDQAGNISFTATVDGFGRLAGFHVVLPRADGGQDLTYELLIKEIGGSVAVVRPTTGIVEAPASIYAG